MRFFRSDVERTLVWTLRAGAFVCQDRAATILTLRALLKASSPMIRGLLKPKPKELRMRWSSLAAFRWPYDNSKPAKLLTNAIP
jgi:hypothetical protein